MQPMTYLIAYLLIGFVAGIIDLKWPGHRFESPDETLFVWMISWPLIVALSLLMGVGLLLRAFLALIGVKAHPGDTHGV